MVALRVPRNGGKVSRVKVFKDIARSILFRLKDKLLRTIAVTGGDPKLRKAAIRG